MVMDYSKLAMMVGGNVTEIAFNGVLSVPD